MFLFKLQLPNDKQIFRYNIEFIRRFNLFLVLIPKIFR